MENTSATVTTYVVGDGRTDIDFGTDRAAAERYAQAYGGSLESRQSCANCYRNGFYTPCGCDRFEE